MLDYGMRPLAHAILDNAADFAWQQDDVFGRIATRYDLLCDVFSLGFHRLWKRRVASASRSFKNNLCPFLLEAQSLFPLCELFAVGVS